MIPVYWILIAAALLLPFPIYCLIITPSPIGAGLVRSSDTGAWLGYYGSVIGGAITLVGVRLTLDKQQRDRIDDVKMIALPFLTFSIDFPAEPPGQYLDTFKPKINIPNNVTVKNVFRRLVIKNSGVGVAVFPSIHSTEFRGGSDQTRYKKSTFTLTPNEIAYVDLHVPYISPIEPSFKLTFGYYDRVRTYYFQVVTIEGAFRGEDSEAPLSTYGLKIVDVTVPSETVPVGTFRASGVAQLNKQ